MPIFNHCDSCVTDKSQCKKCADNPIYKDIPRQSFYRNYILTDECISRETVLSKCQQIWNNADETTEIGVAIINVVDELANFVENTPSANVQPVKHGQWIDYKKLIGMFGTLCDYTVDNGRCDVFCPYTDTKDENDECEAWRTIQKIRQEGENDNR